MRRLGDAGCTVGLIAANTPHVVFDEVANQSPIPLVSMIEETALAATALGLRRLGLFGTRFTMLSAQLEEGPSLLVQVLIEQLGAGSTFTRWGQRLESASAYQCNFMTPLSGYQDLAAFAFSAAVFEVFEQS